MLSENSFLSFAFHSSFLWPEVVLFWRCFLSVFFSFRLVLCAVQYQVQNVIYFSCLVSLYRYQSIPSWSFVSYFSLLSCSQLVPRYLYTLYLHHEINMKDYLYKSLMMLIDDFHFNIFMFNCSIQRFCFRFWVNRNSIRVYIQ